MRARAIPAVGSVQDVLMFVLVLVLLTLVARATIELFRIVIRHPLDVSGTISEALYVFVVIEFIEILMVYLQEHRIAVDFMIEVAIISSLREVIGHGLNGYSWSQILADAAFLLALGLLLRIGHFTALARARARDAAGLEDVSERTSSEAVGELGGDRSGAAEPAAGGDR